MRHPRVVQALLIWLAVISISFFNFQPLLIGAFVTHLSLTEAQAGLLATSHLLGGLIIVVAVAFRKQQWNDVALLSISIIISAFSYLFATAFESLYWLAAIRFVGGIGEGFMGAYVASRLVLFRNPDRLYALMMAAMSLYGMIGFLLLPAVVERYGLSGMHFILAILPLLTLPFCRFLPRDGADNNPSIGGAKALMVRPAVQLVLLSLMLLYAANNGLWAFYERIGFSIGITLEDIGSALSMALLASLGGGLLAALVSDRFGRILPISVGMLGVLSSVITLLFSENQLGYMISIALLFGSVGFIVPYYFGLLASMDSSGRLTVIGTLALSVGNILGPLLALPLVGGESYSVLIVTSGVLFTMALILILSLAARGGSALPSPKPI